MAGYVASGASPLYLLAAVPLVTQQVYTSPSLATDIEIAGSIRAEIEVTPSGPDYQLGCSLWQIPPPSAPQRYLQSGVALIRSNSGPVRLVIDFADIHVLLRAGSNLQIKLQNVSERHPPGGGINVQTIPFFTSVNVSIFHEPSRQSWIDIPVRDEIRPALGAPLLNYSTTTPIDLPFLLESHAGLSGSPYLVLFGISGIAPGAPLGPNETAYLNADLLTNSLLPQVNGPFLPFCSGTLGPNGTAPTPPMIALSQLNLAGFVGIRAAALALVFTPAGTRATNPVEWTFR
jgi:hypothetical protein